MDEAEARGDGRLVLVVVRTGGVAGFRREWRVERHGTESRTWLDLVERCPWEAPDPLDAGADRFVWRIRAAVGDVERARDVSDSALSGAWRELVDAVRNATPGSDPGPTPGSIPGLADEPTDDPDR